MATSVAAINSAPLGAAGEHDPAGAKIFLGIGKPLGHDVEQGDVGSREQPESKRRLRRIPAVLVVPPVLCALAAIGVRFAPGLQGAATSAAVQFTDRAGYAAAVLRGERAPLPAPALAPRGASEKLPSYLSTLAAAAVAALALRGRLRPKKPVALLRWLERMQTGHAGDYVAWITVGCALLGAVFWAAVR